ncbi:MAG: hypothetical protein WC623_18605 [Pedobacter sp.]|jgi:hypothetical protein|uniref:hypothetical protein n=1 Tax=Pedobacter sp. TaxID=1411316 RepID=UPI00356A0A54
MKRTFLALALVSLLAIVPIIVLFGWYNLHLTKKSYDFERRFITPLSSIFSLNLKYDSYYIAGSSGNKLYLGNYVALAHLLKTNLQLTDTQFVYVHINPADYNKNGSYKYYIDTTDFYILNGTDRLILSGKTDKWKAGRSAVFAPYFNQGIPINLHSIIYKYVSSRTNENALRKESTTIKRIENDVIFEKQVDGLFCTAGNIEYNKQLHLLTYTYLYRNEILVIDTNLSLVRKIKTIDPINRADFKVSTIKSAGSSVITSPALMVNSGSSSWDDKLFVQSELMGRNEDQVMFEHSVAIDVYDLKRSAYMYSFYLPKQSKAAISQIKVIGNNVYTLAGKQLSRYTFQLPDVK